nr:MAG TPA: hypothetical protein [Caudoviricetes sp.]
MKEKQATNHFFKFNTAWACGKAYTKAAVRPDNNST